MSAYFESRSSLIIGAVERWIGTPWAPHQCEPQVGADCVQFLGGAMRDAGAPLRAFAWPSYQALGSGEEGLAQLEASIQEALPSEVVPIPETRDPDWAWLRPGDILIFAFRVRPPFGVSPHAAISVAGSKIAHCLRPAGVKYSTLADERLAAALHRVLRPLEDSQ